ncbi:MAG: aspartate aminotransferase family protein [Bacillota bacterium]
MGQVMKMPETSTPRESIIEKMNGMRSGDANWKDGRTWSLVYYAGEEIYGLLKDAYTMFMSENGLNPMAFPSLKQFENEVVAMTADMLGGDSDVAGTMTSGGTESILLVVRTARDWARAEKPHIAKPEMILPVTAHPAFEKAAKYFDVTPVRIPIRDDFRADVAAAREAINENTIMMVGSAPCYPYGVVDPIGELAETAQARGLWFHVDSCLGGFMLPFVRKLGYPVPDFDFRVPGVASISADIHKYGYAAKGASTILYRNKDLRRYQFTVFTEFPGGVYISPTMAGTRPGGAIAAAWAVMKHLGEEGYLKLARKVMDTTRELMDGVRSIPELYILGEPHMSVFAFASDEIDVYALGDAMEARGWFLDRQQNPASLHMMVTPAHEHIAEKYVGDLRDAVKDVLSGKFKSDGGSAAMYGMMASIPDRGMIKTFVLDLMDNLTTL